MNMKTMKETKALLEDMFHDYQSGRIGEGIEKSLRLNAIIQREGVIPPYVLKGLTVENVAALVIGGSTDMRNHFEEILEIQRSARFTEKPS